MMLMMQNQQLHKFLMNTKLLKWQIFPILYKIVKLLIWVNRENPRRHQFILRIVLHCVMKNKIIQAPKKAGNLQNS